MLEVCTSLGLQAGGFLKYDVTQITSLALFTLCRNSQELLASDNLLQIRVQRPFVALALGVKVGLLFLIKVRP